MLQVLSLVPELRCQFPFGEQIIGRLKGAESWGGQPSDWGDFFQTFIAFFPPDKFGHWEGDIFKTVSCRCQDAPHECFRENHASSRSPGLMLDGNESTAAVKISWVMEWNGMRWKEEG